MSEPVTAEALRKAQEAEYGTYRAASPIFIGGARAFNAGDPVPVSHVERGIVRPDEVHKITTKAGREAAKADENPKG